MDVCFAPLTDNTDTQSEEDKYKSSGSGCELPELKMAATPAAGRISHRRLMCVLVVRPWDVEDDTELRAGCVSIAVFCRCSLVYMPFP